ncbi:hypothetical protein GCM10010915_17820 [Microbacterium faecale]|uniref:Uncharacterized protein n=1 Tax=Microbacterium faecale TaxID=1804630 RepID=A0A916YB85_9MICO|nr:hypothetical protein [Microbacterium faecale]GGD37430.1 hypothetical protein GCM10010915_17820 [Microbacterium faecale]
MTGSTSRGSTSRSHVDVGRDAVMTFRAAAIAVADALVRQTTPRFGDRRYGMCGRLRTYDTLLEH